ncbi:hypothetical protein [Rhizobium leguminosarum]|uniref:hypothetical protein n=1 Tax=Rhizobium leguminosarum TaxID=384 RepID=UPI00102FE63D|nr:hypothetical protein [Rhizobium leguminosarum]TAV74784.1 hypothetical protein ELI28_15205 [Rhizobium leguminosarum]TAV79383.1 hypothetical protein ELI27_15195 [Rhizobium leguminosarum]
MNPLRQHLLTGNPMSRLEFAIRLLAIGAAGQSGGVYSAGTLILASALFSSMPPGALIRLGASTTAEDHRLFRTIKRRQRGKYNEKDRDGSGPWPHYESGVRDFLAREFLRYSEEIRERLMSERLAAGFASHEFMYVTSATDSAEIAAPYTIANLDREFRSALAVMKNLYPESYLHYKSELSEVDSLTTFLAWDITPEGRRLRDPMNDVQATMLLYTSSPLRIEAGDAWRYLNKITDEHIANGGIQAGAPQNIVGIKRRRGP